MGSSCYNVFTDVLLSLQVSLQGLCMWYHQNEFMCMVLT